MYSSITVQVLVALLMDIWMVLHLILFAKKNISFKSMGLENPSADGHLSVCTVACVLC